MKQIVLLLMILISSSGSAQDSHIYCSKYIGSTEGKRLLIDDLRSDSIDIRHTFIDLDISSLGSKHIEGYATLSLRAQMNGVQQVRLDLEGLGVDSVAAPGMSGYEETAMGLVIEFSDDIPTNSDIDLTVFYKGFPIKDASGWGGFYFTGQFAWNLGVGFAADPHSYGRVWFPCFDNFIERSTYEFRIATDPQYFASCNGTLQDSTMDTNGHMVYHWLMEDPIPSYLVNVAIGDYEVLESVHQGVAENFPVQLFARAGDTANLSASFIHLHDAISAFEEGYGDHKFDKVGYSLVPFTAGAMEHATNITYPIYAANGGLGNESLMSHELAHMWWGDNVTCQTDGDMWINEGWASFSEYLFDEYVYGRERYEEHLLSDLRYMLQYGHHFEEGYRPVSGQPHEYVYGDHVYKKGALVAHNLRGYLGDEVFFSTIASFMDAYQFQPVSSDTLERYFSEQTGVDLSYFFRDWVFQPGWSVVVLDSFSVDGSNVTLHLQQKLKGRAQYHDEVPVQYTFYSANWERHQGVVMGAMSGDKGTISVSAPFTPVLVTINEDYQLADARTADQLVISHTGNVNLQNMYWTLKVESVQDSALARFEQIWSYPDIIKDYNNKAFRMNDNRYWRVSGIDLDKVQMSGQFMYDGRSSGSQGYLDISLLTENEDSLILLYRESPAEDWDEYAHYEKDILGISVNAIGLMKLDKILPGEYVLANRDTSVLGLAEVPSLEYVIFPNPTGDEFNVEDSSGRVEVIRLYSTEGRLIKSASLIAGKASIDVSTLPAGMVVYELVGSRSEVLETGRLVVQ